MIYDKKIIIFDLDQTILDTIYRFYDVFNETRLKYGLEELPWDVFYKQYTEDTLNDTIPKSIDLQEFWNHFLSIYTYRRHKNDRVISGIREALEKLKQMGYYLIVITSRIAAHNDIKKELMEFGLDDLVDETYALSKELNNNNEKLFSKKGILMHILKKHNTVPRKTIFVADYWVDMVVAKEVNLFTVGVLTGHESKEKLIKHGADVVIDSVRDLPELIKKYKEKN